MAILFLLTAPINGTVVVWDAGANAANPNERTGWKVVPSNLMDLEKDPAKASSDPGYYGREYDFGGSVAVENKKFTAVFARANGSMILYSPQGKRIAAVSLLKGGAVRKFTLVRNAHDEVALDVAPAHGGSAARFTIGRDEIIEISPPARTEGIQVEAPLEYVIAPGFVVDDLVYGAEETGPDALVIPAENILAGLVQGGEQVLVMTWPEGKQRVRAQYGKRDGNRPIQAIELENDSQPVYLAALSAPGIWHREPLDSSFLEKDVTIGWKRPFPAKWQTQLFEGSVRTTFTFRESKGTIWRGVPGMYNYPAWFEGEAAHLNLSKKIPPKGEAIIYFLEGSNTPGGVLTPVDVLKSTLGRVNAEPILDIAGRRLRTHHGEAGSKVHRACTCGYTEAIQAVFEKREETERKAFIDQSINDMIYFVQLHLERIDEYREFARGLTSYLGAKAKSDPELRPYLEELEQIAQQIPQEYENQKENMKSLAYASELQKKTLGLAGERKTDNFKVYMELSKAWRSMGGAQDYVVAQYHTLTRSLFQESARLLAENPKAIAVALDIRERCKQILRNPDGYEIWADY